MTDKIFTAITANYNDAATIRRTVVSVAANKEFLKEHIIVDDGSTDDSVDVLNSLKKEFPHLRVIITGKNRGTNLAVQEGLNRAKGKFVFFVSANDYMGENVLNRAVEALRTYPNTKIFVSDVCYFDDKGDRKWVRSFSNQNNAIFLSQNVLMNWQKKFRPLVNGSAILSIDALKDTNAMDDPLLEYHTDWFAFHAVAYRYGLVYLPQVGLNFGRTRGNYSSKSRVWDIQFKVIERIFNHLNRPENSDIRSAFVQSNLLGFLPLFGRYLVSTSNLELNDKLRLLPTVIILFSYRLVSNIIHPSLIEMINLYLRKSQK